MTNPKQNPMDALKVWKANHRQNATTHPESDLTEKPSKDTRSPKKTTQQAKQGAKPPRIKDFPQLNRQFWLARESVMRCFTQYPDKFHYKAQLAKECRALAEGLKQGDDTAKTYLIGQLYGLAGSVKTAQQQNEVTDTAPQVRDTQAIVDMTYLVTLAESYFTALHQGGTVLRENGTRLTDTEIQAETFSALAQVKNFLTQWVEAKNHQNQTACKE
ncbi:hypothetical protein A4G19_04270 [Pasteurellaceae bacterium Macca]|nr:hypothetical protein [Pasteurellaceae bacterium Macca]